MNSLVTAYNECSMMRFMGCQIADESCRPTSSGIICLHSGRVISALDKVCFGNP